MLENMEFYEILVLAILVVLVFLIVITRLGSAYFRGMVSLLLIAFVAGLLVGPWFYIFVHVFGPR